MWALGILVAACGGVSEPAAGSGPVQHFAPYTPPLPASTDPNFPPGTGVMGVAGATTGDGSIVFQDLVWHPGDAEWTVASRNTFDATPLSDGTLVSFDVDGQMLRSDITGTVWTSTPSVRPTSPGPYRYIEVDGAITYASSQRFIQMGSDWVTEAFLSKSVNGGVRWSQVYQQTRTRSPDGTETGIDPVLVGVSDDGRWIAQSYVSHDEGTTWTLLPQADNETVFALTHKGNAIASTLGQDGVVLWNIYDDHGEGSLLRSFQLVVDGESLRFGAAQLDKDDHVYVRYGAIGGEPRVYRSTTPID